MESLFKHDESNLCSSSRLDTAEDSIIWQYAREHDFIVITKDADFSELISVKGFPPKVIWIRLGNCTTDEVESLIRSHTQEIKKFNNDNSLGILILS